MDGDATRIEQVLGNLLGNALKYTPPGGRITVSLDAREEAGALRARFRIRDDGAGIAPENLASVWELFYQVDTSLARSQSGLGIGLTMVRRLIEMHRGSVAFAFEQAGHHVTSFSLAEDGLSSALDGAYDVAILDIGLPDMDGYELARRTRAALRDVRRESRSASDASEGEREPPPGLAQRCGRRSSGMPVTSGATVQRSSSAS